MTRIIGRFIFIVLIIGSGACSTTEVIATNNSSDSGSELSVVVKRKGLGLFVDQTSFSIGWLNETSIRIPQGRCQIVFISKDIEEINRLLKLAGGVHELNNICIFKEPQ